MCRAIEMNLDNHGMGINKMSDLDILVSMDDEILVGRYAAKDNRSIRLEKTKNKKNRRQKMAKYAYDLIMPNSGKVKDTGFRSYEKGDKVYSRKLRHQKFSEPMQEMDMLDPEVEYIFNLHDLFYSFDWDEEEMFLMGFDKNGNFEGFDFGNPTLYQQMPVLFNEISAYLRGMQKLDKLEEKREELLRKLEELDMDMCHIRDCLKDIF